MGEDTEKNTVVMSTLPKTWILDLDGTLLKPNGYKIDGKDSLLSGALEYIDAIPAEDKIVILTSRTEEYKEMTIDYLKEVGIRYDNLIFNISPKRLAQKGCEGQRERRREMKEEEARQGDLDCGVSRL